MSDGNFTISLSHQLRGIRAHAPPPPLHGACEATPVWKTIFTHLQCAVTRGEVKQHTFSRPRHRFTAV